MQVGAVKANGGNVLISARKKAIGTNDLFVYFVSCLTVTCLVHFGRSHSHVSIKLPSVLLQVSNSGTLQYSSCSQMGSVNRYCRV